MRVLFPKLKVISHDEYTISLEVPQDTSFFHFLLSMDEHHRVALGNDGVYKSPLEIRLIDKIPTYTVELKVMEHFFVFDSMNNLIDYSKVADGSMITVIAEQRAINHILTYYTPLWNVIKIKLDYMDGKSIDEVIKEWSRDDEDDTPDYDKYYTPEL
jgi:hypothetical protein